MHADESHVHVCGITWNGCDDKIVTLNMWTADTRLPVHNQQGLIDEVRIYHRALTTADVAMLAVPPPPPPADVLTDMVAHLSFSEGGGSTLHDSSGAGNNFEMANGVAASGSSGEWLSCSEDKSVGVVDWRGGRVVQVWRGHERGVNRVVAAPRIGGALSASRDTTIRVWKRGQAVALGCGELARKTSGRDLDPRYLWSLWPSSSCAIAASNFLRTDIAMGAVSHPYNQPARILDPITFLCLFHKVPSGCSSSSSRAEIATAPSLPTP